MVAVALEHRQHTVKVVKGTLKGKEYCERR